MAYTESGNKAVQRYCKKSYDQIKIVVKKGEREAINAFAKSKGMSLNGLINQLVKQAMEADLDNNEPQNNG